MSKQKKAKHTPNASSGKPQDKPKSDDALRVELILRNRCGLLQNPNAGPDLLRLTGREWKWGKYTNPDTNQTVEGWAPVNMDSPVTTVDVTPDDKEEAAVDSLLDALLREDDPLLDTLNNWSESDDDRKRRVLSRGFNRALGMREKNPSLPRVPDYTGNPEVDEKNLRQWCIDVQAPAPVKPVQATVITKSFKVSSGILRRAVKEGKLRDCRPAEKRGTNCPLLLDPVEVARYWPRRDRI